MDFIKRNNTKKIKDIKSDGFMLAPVRFKEVYMSKSSEFLLDLFKISKDSISIKNEKKRFKYVEIGSINTETGSVESEARMPSDISVDSPLLLKKNDILISTVRTYLGGIGKINTDEELVASKALIVLRDLKENYNFNYIFGVMRSDFFISQISLILNSGVYPRMDKEALAQIKIPFPTTSNNQEPKLIEILIANLIENITNKEYQIKIKNNEIDKLIQKELNMNSLKINKYDYPKISEIKESNRLDTGLYSSKHKESCFIIENYVNGFVSLSDHQVITGRTPKDYFYTNKKQDNTYLWLTPKNIKGRIIKSKKYLHTKQNTNIQKNDILFTAIGTNNQGHVSIYKGDEKSYINQNTCAIRIDDNSIDNCFALCFLSSFHSKEIIKNLTSNGSVPALYPTEIKKLKIPKFDKNKQHEISLLYFNNLKKEENNNLKNYIKNEIERNKKIGIYQLNIELFQLKEKLNETIRKIVMNEHIDMNLNY